MTDALNSYGLAVGVVIGILSGAFAYFNRERYKTLINDIYIPGNNELRSQLASAKEATREKETLLAEYRAKYEEQSKYIDKLEQLNLRLPDFAALTKLISDNHTKVISKVSEIARKVVDHDPK